MKNECSNYKFLKSLESSLDRMKEASWHIRMMEDHYHEADAFRWSLNSFLRSLKEVLQLVSMEVQHSPRLVDWLRKEKESVAKDPLIALLYRERDELVHRSMLKPASKGMIGFTKGRGMKLGMSIPINPLEDSRLAILRYIDYAAKETDFMGILCTDHDCGEYTCVERTWRLESFPDQELVHLSAGAWEKVARIVIESARHLGADVVDQQFTPRPHIDIQMEIYDPLWIREELEAAKQRNKQSRT